MTQASLNALIPALLLISTSCGLTNYYFKTPEIDRDLHLLPIGSQLLAEPTLGSYYYIFHMATGLTSVDHFEKKPGAAEHQRLLYLETNHTQILDRTVKDDEIL